MLPMICMFVGFLLAATNVWMIQNGRHRFSSPRGLGLSALALVILAAPVLTLTQIFRPASYISSIWGYHGATGRVLWVHSTADLAVGGRLYRVALVEPDSGRRTHRLPVGSGQALDDHDALRILAVTDDKIWCYSDGDGLHARSPYDATPFLHKKDLLKLYPILEHSAAGDHRMADGIVLRTKPDADSVELVSVPARSTPLPPDPLAQSFLAARPGAPGRLGGDPLTVENNVLSRGGTTPWRLELSGAPSVMTVFEGTLYVGVGGTVLAIAPQSGLTRWATSL